MGISKVWVGMMSGVALMAMLAGCGTDPDATTTEGKSGAVEVSIVEGSLKTDIAKVEGSEYKYVFSIQNDTEKDQTLIYPSSQEYDYTIKDGSGNILYTYSMDKSFLQVVKEVVVKPGERLDFELDLTEGLPYIETGTYTVEVWATLKNSNDLKAVIKFDYQAPDQEGKQVVNTTVPVTYVGQIDGNSIEVINEEGLPEAYRLSEVTKEQVNTLSKNDSITIEFTTDANGLRVAQYFTVVTN